MDIVFFGTPDFAASQLEFLVSQNVSVVAVVTAPDKAAGRGKKLKPSAVKECAIRHNIAVLQPVSLRHAEFLSALESYKAEVFVVIAFRMLPESVWKMPAKGTFNLHASLLPDYRGAAPINRAIMNGETQTGLTTFFLNEEIDTGNIILQQKLDIGPNETAGELHDRMVIEGQKLVLQTLNEIETGRLKLTKQADKLKDNLTIHPAPKLFKDDCLINWSKSIEEIHNQIRGLSPVPGAFTVLSDSEGQTMELKIYRSRIEKNTDPKKADFSVLTDNRSYLKVAIRGNYLVLENIQQSGKKILNIKDFLNGFKFEGNWRVL